MDRRGVLSGVGLGLLGATIPSLGAGNASRTQPNIVFILTDDQGWKDLGCTGSQYYQTPHIDKLADEGLLFTQAYAAAPICSPSRGAIYSGQYPARSKFTAVVRPYVEPDADLHEVSKHVKGNLQTREALHRHCLPPGVPTIAEMLGDAYYTGFIGKWHCGWNQAHWPDKRGWDVAEGFRTVASATKGHFGRDFAAAACKGLEGLDDDQYMTDVLTDRAEAFLRDAAKGDRPFFLTLSHYAVHMPLDAPADLVEKYRKLPATDQENPVYAAMIEKVDQSVGRIMQTLDELGVADNTLVIFTSDNGGLSPMSTSNFPLLGGKSFCYEAAMRVPLIMRWPNVIPAGRRESTRTVAVDFVPTWLEMAGVTAPESTTQDGQSLLPLMTAGRRPGARPIYFHHPHYTHAAGPFSSIIEEDWKLIRFYNASGKRTAGGWGEQLFDLAADPYEQDDLIASRPRQVAKLRRQLDAWLAETDAELPRPNEQFDASAPADKDQHFTWNLAQRIWAKQEAKWRESIHRRDTASE